MDDKERIKHFYENIVSNHLLDELPNYVSDGCTARDGRTVAPLGIDGMKQHLIGIRKTYPDFKMTIIRQFCDGDYVISEFITEGTHIGEFLGIKPTGKVLAITGVDIDKVADGKIVEHGGATNTFEAFFEAGIIQPI